MKKDFKFIFGAICVAVVVSAVAFFGDLFPREKLFAEYARELYETDVQDLTDTALRSEEG